jgi:hypothetical protein
MDMATISVFLSSVKTATEIAQGLKDSDLSLDKAETKLQLAELISALADAKIQAAMLQDELLTTNRRIREIEEAQRVHDHEMKWDGVVYWREVNSNRDGPFCPQCYDSSKHKSLIRLQKHGSDHWVCPTCKNDYFGENFSPGGFACGTTSFDPYD